VKALRQKVEIVLARMACAMVAPMSRRAVLALAGALGWLGYSFSRSLRQIGMANLDLVFGETKTRDEKHRILKRSCRNFALVGLDLFWFSRDTKARIARWVAFEAEPKDVVPPGAALFVTGHLGNWEVLGCALALRGYPPVSVASPVKNPEVDRIVNRLREVTGQRIVPRQGALRELLKTLREGGYVAILQDQNTRIREGGVYMDFFGVPAAVTPATGVFSARLHVPVVMGFCLAQPDGSYRVCSAGPPIEPPALPEYTEAAAREVSERILAEYERLIRDHPEDWLWMYKRWKYYQPGTDRARYPFYTKA
jgi:Kdo2-lipid IVA lauroyltransferase/acyltransferase